MFPAAILLREPMVFLTHPLLLHRPRVQKERMLLPGRKEVGFQKKLLCYFCGSKL